MTHVEELRTRIEELEAGWAKADHELKAKESEIAALRELVNEVIRDHADDSSGFYNECDKSPCQWCAEAKEAK